MVLNNFNPHYEIIDKLKKQLEVENSRLASLRDTLLPRLMSGELKVNEIENFL